MVNIICFAHFLCKTFRNIKISVTISLDFSLITETYSAGIADLTVKALENEGLTLDEARERIWMMDINGLLAVDRPEGGLDGHKKFYAKKHNPIKDFAAVVNEIKPSVLIGERK